MSPILMIYFEVRGRGLLFNYLLLTNISKGGAGLWSTPPPPPLKNSGASV